jgi:hypothetical protein
MGIGLGLGSGLGAASAGNDAALAAAAGAGGVRSGVRFFKNRGVAGLFCSGSGRYSLLLMVIPS